MTSSIDNQAAAFRSLSLLRGLCLALALWSLVSLSPAAEPPMSPASWTAVEASIEAQKFQEALDLVGELVRDARSRGDDLELAKALTTASQLRIALGRFETAVETLRRQRWPRRGLGHLLVSVYYVQSLRQYVEVFGYEIRSRERQVSRRDQPLEVWTMDQIAEEIERVFADVWTLRGELGELPRSALSDMVELGTYPEGVRSTARDTLTYWLVEVLADQNLWSPREQNEASRLDVDWLLRGHLASKPVSLADPAVHPLVKIAYVLDDLGAFHRGAGRGAGELEARLERARRLNQALTSEPARAKVRAYLDDILPLYRDLPWWSAGMVERARMERSREGAWSRVEARRIAEAGRSAYPESWGGRACAALIAQIEAPSYRIEAMKTDGPGRPSVRIVHRNIEKLFFRAYRFDLGKVLLDPRWGGSWPSHRHLLEIARTAGEPVATWSTDLPPTPDFRDHITYLVPPLEESGSFVVLASVTPSFEEEDNILMAFVHVVTGLVVVERVEESGLVIDLVDGATGRPAAGAAVQLIHITHRGGPQPAGTFRADDTGRVVVPRADLESKGRYQVVAEWKGQRGYGSSISSHWSAPPTEDRGRFVMTDRAVYRPGQVVHWKVVGYLGNPRAGSYRVAPEEDLRVVLYDANGREVEAQQVRTNAHGSASGRFVIPAGRLLGRWRVQADKGWAPILVEEVKRPTFEVKLDPPKTPMRLNRPARLSGSATYYFGLPLSQGDVTWTVRRRRSRPIWWAWYGSWLSAFWGPGEGREQIVAAGTTQLDRSGRFEVAFRPEADPAEAADRRRYTYTLEVAVTNEGGETRRASKSYTLGFVSVEAAIELPAAVVSGATALEVTVARRDLSGQGVAGEGEWRLVRLVGPAAPPLPADLLAPDPATFHRGDRPPYLTPGDRRRPRWQQGYRLDEVLRSFDAGESIAEGHVRHDDQGQAALTLGRLEPGAYRLHYTTKDPFGAPLEVNRDFIVYEEEQPAPAPVPLAVALSSPRAEVGERVRLAVMTGFAEQRIHVELSRWGTTVRRETWDLGRGAVRHLDLDVGPEDRGGLALRVWFVRDYQLISWEGSIEVPWTDRRLDVVFETFRDRLRPGEKELWRLRIRASGDPQGAPVAAAEVLATMYDRSLDVFLPYRLPPIGALYPHRGRAAPLDLSLGQTRVASFHLLEGPPPLPSLTGNRPRRLDGYGVGGIGRHIWLRPPVMEMAMAPQARAVSRGRGVLAKRKSAPRDALDQAAPIEESRADAEKPAETEAPAPLRSNFAKTAFWAPHLISDEEGRVTIEFTPPDSVTSWKVAVQALTTDLRVGTAWRQVQTAKDLMVRPYLPRFLREGDELSLRVVVDNATADAMAAHLELSLVDPSTGNDVSADFGLEAAQRRRAFQIDPRSSTTLRVPLRARRRPGLVALEVRARAGEVADGERRVLPILPSRLHLAQSRFATLKDVADKELFFPDMLTPDPSRIDEQLVVTIDGQLFYGVLAAVPYLLDYPYECTEQTLNRFLSAGILTRVFADHPAVAAMAETFSQRETPYERFDDMDPNRRMLLAETPWVRQAAGEAPHDGVTRVLDPRVAAAETRRSLDKLAKAQTASGGYPWWPGGPASPWMTLYILRGLSRARSAGIDVPPALIEPALRYLKDDYFQRTVADAFDRDCCAESVALINYTLTGFSDEEVGAAGFEPADRRRMLDFTYRHRKDLSPLVKALFALTAHRLGEARKAREVFEVIMDSARTDPDLGTYWAPEDHAWRWYNDTIETQAFILEAMIELDPEDPRRDGLVQWLFLNKKLNHWKSTRATAEVIYSLVKVLEARQELAVREVIDVEFGGRRHRFVFEPDRYEGKKNQLLLVGEEIRPERDARVRVSKETPGLAFASATWHFSTDELPDEARGDFFEVRRSYFRREVRGDEVVLVPLAEGARLAVGDEVDVHLSLRSKHEAEYVHLRDPKAAGLEPGVVTSRWRWDQGIVWYESFHDSSTDFFFERLPAGEYTLTYRLRVAATGAFRVGPARVQSMYAPEFVAYSSGTRLVVEE